MERSALVQELKTLRKGRGLAGRIEHRVGPILRSACAVSEDDGLVAIRTKVAGRLTELASHLPDDLRVAALAAFAICAEARQPLYRERVQWAASRVDRDPRTVRRRVDEAIDMLAELASSSSVSPADRWHMSSLAVALVLDQPRPLVLERRRIVAVQDGLRSVDLVVPLAERPDLTLLYGGTLRDQVLDLPRPLSRGESLEFAVLFGVPTSSALESHWVCVPQEPCDSFDLHVRFGEDHPREVRTVDGAFRRDVTDPGYRGRREVVDPAGEVHLRFRGLTPGLAYGARWDACEDRAPL